MEKYLFVMDLKMLFQVRARSKLFQTFFAGIGFVSWMYSLVSYQVRYLPSLLSEIIERKVENYEIMSKNELVPEKMLICSFGSCMCMASFHHALFHVFAMRSIGWRFDHIDCYTKTLEYSINSGILPCVWTVFVVSPLVLLQCFFTCKVLDAVIYLAGKVHDD
jgi:hypothetical protein